MPFPPTSSRVGSASSCAALSAAHSSAVVASGRLQQTTPPPSVAQGAATITIRAREASSRSQPTESSPSRASTRNSSSPSAWPGSGSTGHHTWVRVGPVLLRSRRSASRCIVITRPSYGRERGERERPIAQHGRARTASPRARNSRHNQSPWRTKQATVLPFPHAPEAIELRHLRAFVAVAEELNFARAAERLYVSAPALSRQIRALERLVGCELLERSTHRVELTLAGEALLERARAVLRDVDAAVQRAQSVGGELVGRVARLWEPVVDLSASDAGIDEMRAAFETLMAQFAPPPEIDVRAVNAGGVPALSLSPQPDRPATLLYLHGGAYVLGSAFGYRHLAGALAAAAGTGVLVPDFRLAPEHPFPAALDDALAAYEWMIEGGTPPERIGLVGRLVGRRPGALAAPDAQAAGAAATALRGAAVPVGRPELEHRERARRAFRDRGVERADASSLHRALSRGAPDR